MNPERLMCRCSGPWLPLMLTWRASEESVSGCVWPCPFSPKDTAPPGLPGLSRLGTGAAAVLEGLLCPDTWLVKSPAFPHLLSPSSPERSCLDASPQHLLYPQSRKSQFNPRTSRFRAECGWEFWRNPATLFWTRGRVYRIKIDAKPCLADFTGELKAGYCMTKPNSII